MPLPVVILAILASLLFPAGAGAAAGAPAAGGERRFDIRVAAGGWGEGSLPQIEAALQSVAEELAPPPAKGLPFPVRVSHTEGNPIALYDRGPAGEYLVRLHASGDRWHLYVYEFAHELCHILANYDEHVGADISRHNQWLEESLCETASLYALEHLAASWERMADPEWSARADRLRRFFDLLVAERHRQLPPQTPLADWLKGNEADLRQDPYQRQKNDLVAARLLPLFEQSPRNWDALRYLNLDPADARASLADYLRHWQDNAPGRHKPFVAALSRMLGAGEAPPVSLARTAQGD